MKKTIAIVTSVLLAITLNAQHTTKIFRDVEWANINGQSLTVDIHVPQTGKESYPVLVVYHGGGWLINNNRIMEEMSVYISEHSEYIICNVNYRLLGDNNNSTLFNEIIEDAFGALLWVKENISSYKGDPEQIAITGDSAGGHLTSCILNMGRNLSDKGFSSDNLKFKPTYIPKGKSIDDILAEDLLEVQAAIISYGAFDIYTSCAEGKFETEKNLFWMFAGVEPRGLFGETFTVESNPELYKAVSPIFNIPEADNYKLPPMLFTVGSEDDLTTPELIMAYVEKLEESGQAADVWVYEGRPHAFLDSGSNEYLGINFEKDAIAAIQVMIEFLDSVFVQ